MKTYFRSNDPIVFCDICGAKFHRSQCRKQWNGLLACLPNDCWSPKHPFDSPLPTVIDDLSIFNARPEGPDVFIEGGFVSVWGGSWLLTYPDQLGRASITLPNPIWGAIDVMWQDIG